jgi:hypothetical protein
VKPLYSIFLAAAIFVLCSMCKKDPEIPPYKTKHVIIVVMDGARYQETFGNGELTYIPNMAQMSVNGSVCTNFHNPIYTFTNGGHAAMTTGVDEFINNSGFQFPTYPGIFQYWRQAYNAPQTKCWIVASKDKLFVLSNCDNPADSSYDNQFMASYDCGINGPFTGYRDDSTTFNRAMSILSLHHPDLMLVNFKEPDASGHANNWSAYLNGIIQGDIYVQQIWDYLQSDPYYAGTTTLFVTNDHGRHDDGHLDGFVSHGDNCEGCKHVMLLAMGPDFKENYSCDEPYVLCDIAKTTSTLMSFPMPTGTGRMMTKILK